MAIANYFYNETTRRYVALFGTLFNQIKIERTDNTGATVQSMIVPLSYAPFQKVLSRLNEDPDLLNSKRTAIALPRMSFEITSFQYDPARKIGSTQKLRKEAKAEADSSRNFVYSSVPYNLDFSLYIMTKYSEDATKIMEQILPFFTPDWTVTAQMVPDLDPIDIPIVLNGVPEPLRIVLTTVVGVGPAAFELVFSTAIADGCIDKENATVIATRYLLTFMVHQNFCVGI